MRKKKCYNSGKISGLPYNQAYLKFENYDKLIEQNGYKAVSPIKQGLRPCAPYWAHMAYDIWLLLRCDAILLQPDWRESKGARIEKRVAELFCKELFFIA